MLHTATQRIGYIAGNLVQRYDAHIGSMIANQIMPAPDILEVRIGKGNTSNRPLPNPPERIEGDILAPDWLTGDALICFHHVTEILKLRGQLSRESFWSVIAFCECWAEWLELRSDIALNGRVTKVLTTAGQRSKGKRKDPDVFGEQDMEPEENDACFAPKVRPEVQLFSDCDKRLRGWLQEFGLTDASRSKVGKPETPPLPKPKPKGKGDAPSIGDYGLSSH